MRSPRMIALAVSAVLALWPAATLGDGLQQGLPTARSRTQQLISDQRARLDRFVAEKQTRVRIEAASRNRKIERAVALRNLGPDPSPSQQGLFLQRLAQQDAADLGPLRVEIDRLERHAGRPLGPVTRRVLEAALAREELRREQQRRALGQAASDGTGEVVGRPLLPEPGNESGLRQERERSAGTR